MLNDSKQTFAILLIKPNSPHEVVALIKSLEGAEKHAALLTGNLSPEACESGWSYFCDRTSIRVNTSLAVANELRQEEYRQRIYPTQRRKPRKFSG